MGKVVSPYPLGAEKIGDKMKFSFASASPNCGIYIYNKKEEQPIMTIPFSEEDRIGHVYTKLVDGLKAGKFEYLFYQDDKTCPDYHGKYFSGRENYGTPRMESQMRAVVPAGDYDWKDDKCPYLSYADSVWYGVHVRGFTMHSSSKVTKKGTFRGVIEKIPYLKDLGVTTLEFQPIYEFLEREKQDESVLKLVMDQKKDVLNYWGYKKGFYYAPKSAYSSKEDSATECKDMIHALHENQMEAVLQFYFPEQMPGDEVIQILRFWVLEYHVDGFHLMGNQLPITAIAKDPLLADTKLLFYDFALDEIYGREKAPAFKNLAIYNDEYLYDMRQFLKGDDHKVSSAIYQMRNIPSHTGRIHFLSNYYGFSLMDMVSFDWKHNEENGENNQDGTDYNCSWNCGEEGKTRKKKIAVLRTKQLKNAMVMLLLSASTPFLFMGDEFGRSQKGNNNPYCQDNETTWVNWKDMERNQEIYEFFRTLMKLRKEHPVLHRTGEAKVMDGLACGYPDLSYHGQNAWRYETDGSTRSIGIMFCGKYAMKENDTEDNFFYIGMNMHWEKHSLAMPRLPKGYTWEMLLTTAEENRLQQDEKTDAMELVKEIAPRSIFIYISREDAKEKK